MYNLSEAMELEGNCRIQYEVGGERQILSNTERAARA